MQVEGRCHCGQIKFQSEVDTEEVEICHCTDCQSLSGSAFHTMVSAIDGTFEVIQGELKQYTKVADDGTPRVQSFCPVCGSPICSSPPSDTPGVLRVRVGALNQKNQLVPKAQYWLRSSQPWTQSIAEMKKMETE
ncbi:MAG: GFA family protein [Pseudomonadota bacterium]